jgi:hypothetical protein
MILNEQKKSIFLIKKIGVRKKTEPRKKTD